MVYVNVYKPCAYTWFKEFGGVAEVTLGVPSPHEMV
jgi:hypothetical protein